MSEATLDAERLLREERAAAEARERELLLALVAVADGFSRLERALAGEELCGKAASLLSRFSLVRRRVESALEREGVLRVDSLGHPANGEIHEIVETRPSEHPEGTILDVDQDAYLHRGSVLRTGRVVASGGAPLPESTEDHT